jgi:signal transduction histidine kinase/ligand-binding sensor domain-containing protein
MTKRFKCQSLSLFLFVFVYSAVSLIAKENLFKTWNTENGLPQNSVTSIAQTSDGYIWLATFDGLARFDGVRFKVFRKLDNPELPTNRVTGLFIDPVGRLWILTEDANRIVVYENGRFKSFAKGKDFETNDMSEPWRLKTEMVLRNDGTEFFYEDGRFRSRAASVRKLPNVFWDEHQDVWIDRGDHYVSGKNGRLESYPKKSAMPFDGLRLIARKAVVIEDSLWFLMPHGGKLAETRLARLRNGEVTEFPVRVTDTTALELDRENNLWIGDLSYGAVRIDAKTLASADPRVFPSTDAGLADMKVRGMFADRDRNLWMYSDRGLSLLKDPPSVRVYSAADGLPTENIYSVVQDKLERIWFGGWEKHLIRYEDGRFFPEPFDLVTALFEDRDSRLWVGNRRIWYRDGNAWRLLEPNWDPGNSPIPEIDVISQDSSGNIWYGGAVTGISRYDGNSIRKFMTADGLPSASVTSFLQTRDGTIWVGTVTGLARLEGDRFVSFTTADGLGGNYIRSLYEDAEGILWIGTYDSGITRFKDGKFASVTSRQGLFSDGVFCILEDDGWFWMNSNQGIHRTPRQDLNDVADSRASTVASIAYGPEDGLTNVEGNGGKQPAGIKASDGKLWFPTAGGLAVVDPRKARRASGLPPVLIEDVLIDQSAVLASGGAVRIEPGQSAIDIAYTAPVYRGADRLRFRYRLEGLDSNWTEAGMRRTANFSHIPYGEYTFRVIAANQDGVWNNEGAALKIVVVPPFYRTYWFYTLSALTAALILGGAYFYRVRQLQAINNERADFTRRLIDSQEHERRRIALELHDSLGQSLTIIRNRALMSLKKTDEHQTLIEQMREISDASAEALRETREIARNLHPAQIEHLGLPAALATLVESIANGTSIALTKEIDDHVAPLTNDEAINLYRIAQESLSNIIKHSKANMASVALHQTDDHLTLFIEDDGSGFVGDGSHSGLGLKGVHERAGIIGAQLKIHSSPGKGTRITVLLPNKNGRANTNIDS